MVGTDREPHQLLFGNMAGLFQQVVLHEIPREQFNHELVQKSLTLVYLGIGSYASTYISTVAYMSTGERLTRIIRQKYFSSLLRQNMAFFDNTGSGVLSSSISLDCQTIQDGISERVAFAITAVATLVSAYIIGFIKYWKLTLVASAIFVVMTTSTIVAGKIMVKCIRESMATYSLAGGLAEEVLSTIRTVKTLGAREKFAARFETHLAAVEKCGRKSQLTIAIMIAIFLTTTFMSHSLTFWSGSIFIANHEASVSDVITVGFAILVGSHVLSGIGPHVRAFTSAIGAASKVFAIIDRPSPLDPASEEGARLDHVFGEIEFRAITHIYPSRPKQVVMRDMNMRIPAGKTTAIVGPSGSGKSTIVGLLERFYSPLSGEVLLDGHDISTLNLRWFRQRLGLVGQEPVLFGTTIFENIATGLSDVDESSTSSEKDGMPVTLETRVHTAAKQANAHDFILKLPQGYNTILGEGGSQLSGGQKQRIAIARALVRDPAVLLLDEATSALDSESEQTVREAIRSASVGRTTVIVSHRLSTITESDNIIVLSSGKVVEEGTHTQLQTLGGIYANLFKAQQHDRNPETSHASKDTISAAPAKSSTEVSVAPSGPAPQAVGSGNGAVAERSAEDDDNKASLWTLIKLTASFNRPEAKYLVIGLIFSILTGCGGPTLAFLLAHAISELSKPESMVASMRAGANFWCLLMFVVGIIQFINLMVQGVSFAVCSERLVYRARATLFRALLQKDVSYFDKEENRTGALTAPLGMEAKNLSGVSGSTLGTILMCSSTLVAAAVVSLAVGWKVALVCLATVPVLLVSGFWRVWMIAQFAQRSHQAQRASSAYASEAVMSVRTIASLASDHQVCQHYERMLKTQEKKSLVSIFRSSLPFAGSQSFSFFCVALAFWYGGNRIASGEYTIFQFFLCFAEVIFGAQSAGMVFSFATDIGKAKKAAATFHTMLRRTPAIDDARDSDRPLVLADCRGGIEFEGVHFSYPNRPEASILNGLDFAVRPGEHVALVGASGCGKSTCFGLVERLYDPDAGRVRMDDEDIRGFDVATYRGALAYVSQEPTIYSGTIRENVVLGAGPSQAEPSEEEIIQACKDANIYDFVLSLP